MTIINFNIQEKTIPYYSLYRNLDIKGIKKYKKSKINYRTLGLRIYRDLSNKILLNIFQLII